MTKVSKVLKSKTTNRAKRDRATDDTEEKPSVMKDQRPRSEQPNRVGAILADLDLASLSASEISEILFHCAAMLKDRMAVVTQEPGMVFAKQASLSSFSATDHCFIRAANSPEVYILAKNTKDRVGKMPNAETALARGIDPCGG